MPLPVPSAYVPQVYHDRTEYRIIRTSTHVFGSDIIAKLVDRTFCAVHNNFNHRVTTCVVGDVLRSVVASINPGFKGSRDTRTVDALFS